MPERSKPPAAGRRKPEAGGCELALGTGVCAVPGGQGTGNLCATSRKEEQQRIITASNNDARSGWPVNRCQPSCERQVERSAAVGASRVADPGAQSIVRAHSSAWLERPAHNRLVVCSNHTGPIRMAHGPMGECAYRPLTLWIGVRAVWSVHGQSPLGPAEVGRCAGERIAVWEKVS